MNPQGAGKIEWCHFTWNPITGCKHGCPYCYVPRVKGRFEKNPMEPRLHKGRLTEPFSTRQSRLIFVGSTGDMWGEWVPREWIEQVLTICREAHWHKYLFLTKNPIRYRQFAPIIPSNCWCGTSVSGGTMEGHDFELKRVNWLHKAPAGQQFISLEPWLGRLSNAGADVLIDSWIATADWLIVGGLTGPRAIQPPTEDLADLVETAKTYRVPLFVKDNAGPGDWPKEYPEGLR
ncbi:phage Gp37/Gp68 family protein [bacterium]|nr:phage Gp37/Gp68 family protein [bacterium]